MELISLIQVYVYSSTGSIALCIPSVVSPAPQTPLQQVCKASSFAECQSIAHQLSWTQRRADRVRHSIFRIKYLIQAQKSKQIHPSPLLVGNTKLLSVCWCVYNTIIIIAITVLLLLWELLGQATPAVLQCCAMLHSKCSQRVLTIEWEAKVLNNANATSGILESLCAYMMAWLTFGSTKWRSSN